MHKKNQEMGQDLRMNEQKLGIKHYSLAEDMKFKQMDIKFKGDKNAIKKNE